MIFIETPIFTADVQALLSDEEYTRLQDYLVGHPDAGDVVAGTGGLRKIRWTSAGKGKRGGSRVNLFPCGGAIADPDVADLPQGHQG